MTGGMVPGFLVFAAGRVMLGIDNLRHPYRRADLIVAPTPDGLVVAGRF